MGENIELDRLLSTSGGEWQVQSQSGGTAWTKPECWAQSWRAGTPALGGLVYV